MKKSPEPNAPPMKPIFAVFSIVQSAGANMRHIYYRTNSHCFQEKIPTHVSEWGQTEEKPPKILVIFEGFCYN